MKSLLLLLAAVLSLASCVHEFPEIGGVTGGNPLLVTCTVNVSLSIDSLTMYKEIYTTRTVKEDYLRSRFVIEVYPEGTNEPVFHDIVYREANDTSAISVPLVLFPQRYSIVA